MTNSQLKLLELAETRRHNQELEEIQAKDAETRRKQHKLDIARTAIDAVDAVVPKIKVNTALGGRK